MNNCDSAECPSVAAAQPLKMPVLFGRWHNGKFPAENFDFGCEYSGTHWMKELAHTSLL